MNEMSAISVINLLPENKAEIQTFVRSAKEQILSGESDVLKIAKQLKVFEETIKQLREDLEIKSYILSEAEKEGKSFKKYDCKFSIQNTGVKYDYSTCQDPDWSDLDTEIKRLTELRKAKEEVLKVHTEPFFNSEGIQIFPPVKSGSLSVVITLDK